MLFSKLVEYGNGMYTGKNIVAGFMTRRDLR
jgi:hypothetical protein